MGVVGCCSGTGCLFETFSFSFYLGEMAHPMMIPCIGSFLYLVSKNSIMIQYYLSVKALEVHGWENVQILA